jgi:hypothetical protein
MGGDAGARDFVVCGVKSGPVMFVVNKASDSASIIGSIMQTRSTKLLMWQLINKERGD